MPRYARVCGLLLLLQSAFAAEPPNYMECRLDTLFPAGGQVGQTLTVEFRGNNGGLDGAKDIVIDGPPGITVAEIKNVSGIVVQAKLQIAPDAVPGRRLLRVLNERSGMTCFGWFVVGRLPEVIEVEKQPEPQSVTLPVVVNGRVDPAADVDAFSFEAKAGQKLVAAIRAHAIDIHGQGRNWGIADTTLEIVDERGRVVAESQDALGLDPQIEFTPPVDGRYTAKVQLLGYGGFPEAVYRLTLGEVPVVTSVFPPGGQRGTTVAVEYAGPNVPPGTSAEVVVPDAQLPLQYLFPDHATAGDHDVPFVRGDLPEVLEAEPNDAPEQATRVEWPMTINARFLTPGDSDWYRLALKKGQTVSLEITAHKYLRSPVDTLIQVHDAEGKLLAENDDDPTPMDYMSIHDFKTTDSRLSFTAPAEGDYLVRVSEQAGAGGHRCVYRLMVKEALADFEMLQFPDAVPVWGPGSTASLLVKVDRLHGFKDAVELSIDGLPAGWTGSMAVSPAPQYAVSYGKRTFLTITAPADAQPGTCVPFRVIGTATINGEKVQRVAQPITLFYSSDIGFFRVTPQARVAVARPQGPRFEPMVMEMTVEKGATGSLPVRVHGSTDTTLTVVANVASDGVKSNIGSPQALPVKDGVITVAVPTESLQPGTHSLVVSGRWGGDIRIGMPGPSTPVVQLHVTAK